MRALRTQLAGDEPDGHDAVLLGGVQEPLAGPLPGRVVLERDLVEPGEGVAHVRLVVDGQPSPAERVYVSERAVRQSRPVAVFEPGHLSDNNRPRRHELPRSGASSGWNPVRIAAEQSGQPLV